MRSNIKEYFEVENVARKFAQAVHEGKGSICRPYFSDRAKVYGYLDGVYQECTADEFAKQLDDMGADPAHVARVDVLDVEETVALVRVIEDNWFGHDFTDYLNMIKTPEGWKIFAKVYNQNSVRD